MGFAIYPKYEDWYIGSKPDVTDLLKNIPSVFTINTLCSINALKYMDFLDIQVDIGIFQALIERLDQDRKDYLTEKAQVFTDNLIKQNQAVTLFPLTTTLRLIEHEVLNFKTGDFTQITTEQEENILKAILVANQTEEEEYLRDARKIKTKTEFETFIAWLWPNMLPIMEFQFKKEILIPIHYSIQFFKYLEQTPKYKPYLTEYLNNNNATSWHDYLRKLALFYMNGYNREAGKFYFKFDASILESNKIITSYVLDINQFNKEEYLEKNLNKNFKLFREKPIIRFPDNSYCITNWNFIVDKYYQGQKYDFFNSSGIKAIYNGTEDQKFQTFSGELGQHFIEKILFRETMKKYLTPSGGVQIPENNLKGWKQDYYFRLQQHVCFIEFKATTLPVSNKFQEIKESVDHPGKLKKAVLQLVSEISAFANNINKFENLSDQGLTPADLFIYPIIVYTDINWSMYGVREYLNNIFWHEIKDKQLNSISVREPALIHIDLFYEYEKLFLEDKLSFHTVVWKHNMNRALYLEQNKKSPGVETAMQKYADASFYLKNSFKGKYTPMIDSSLFESMLTELGIPRNL